MVRSETGVEPHKFEPVRIPVGLDEFVYIPFYHPFGYHSEMLLTHRHTQKWEHVRMTETVPRHYFPAEPLCNRNQQFCMQDPKV